MYFLLKTFLLPIKPLKEGVDGIRENGETCPPPQKKKYKIIIIKQKLKLIKKKKFNIRYESDGHIYI